MPPRRPRVGFSVTSKTTTDGDTFSATETKASLSCRATFRPDASVRGLGSGASAFRFGAMHPAIKAPISAKKIAALDRFIFIAAIRFRRLLRAENVRNSQVSIDLPSRHR
jgi:hypothetical protein